MKPIKGNQRGGARPGAGRKPGTANLKTREIADRAAAEGVTPLDYMLKVMRNPKTDQRRRDEMARAAAPYLHSRLANRDNPISMGPLAGDLAEHGRQVLAALSDGRLAPGEATTVMQALASQSRIVEASELEGRVAALEAVANEKKGRQTGGGANG